MPPSSGVAAELARLAALARYAVLDTAPEQAFDDVARLAALVCDAPVAHVNFVDATRQWSKASTGAPRGDLPRKQGFCLRTILQPWPLIIEDVAADPYFAALAPGYGEPRVAFYAGIPVVTSDGHAIGTVCVLDYRPRELSAGQRDGLLALGRQAVLQLELRQPGSPQDHAGLRERAESFRRLATAANEGITIIVDDRIVEANNAFASLFGYEMSEIVGRSALEFVAPESRDIAVEFATISSEKPYEARARRKNGSTFDMEVTTKSIPYKGRTVLGCVVRDISERKEIDRLKNEFVSIVSHELRTPLTSIRGSLGLMEGGAVGELPPKAQDLARIARQNADRLIRLINDILDLEKIESGKIQLQIAALDPAEVVESTIAELRGMSELYRMTLTARVHRHDPVAGDRDRVVQVLMNLLSNAMKFSPEGGVVSVGVEDGAAGFLRFSVSDQGPGIAENQRARLFTRFEQLEAADTRKRGGTGLGLAISRSLVEQQGGRIGVDSVPGKGSVFWFELPVVRAAVSTAPEMSHRPGILMVEDDPAVARVLRIILERAGHYVVHAGSLNEARHAADLHRPSVILLDMGLPDGSGLELLDHLPGIEGAVPVPVVVLSGSTPTATHRNARVVDWLTKPFAAEELLRAIHVAVSGGSPGAARRGA